MKRGRKEVIGRNWLCTVLTVTPAGTFEYNLAGCIATSVSDTNFAFYCSYYYGL